MLNNQRPDLSLALTTTTTTTTERSTSFEDQNQHQRHDYDDDQSPIIRDIHALTPPRAPLRQASWETGSHRSPALSIGSSTTEGGENFTTMSREFNALVMAGSTETNLDRIGEEETNPLAIVRDTSNPLESPRPAVSDRLAMTTVDGNRNGELTVQRVKKEEVDSKISAWQNAKIAKINNRFKREDAVINGWEGEQVQKASSWMKKIERKLEEKRAKAQEKMQNDIAKAHRKAEERRASSEAKRGTKVARILEIANLMKAVGRPPVKRSFF